MGKQFTADFPLEVMNDNNCLPLCSLLLSAFLFDGYHLFFSLFISSLFITMLHAEQTVLEHRWWSGKEKNPVRKWLDVNVDGTIKMKWEGCPFKNKRGVWKSNSKGDEENELFQLQNIFFGGGGGPNTCCS